MILYKLAPISKYIYHQIINQHLQLYIYVRLFNGHFWFLHLHVQLQTEFSRLREALLNSYK